MTYTKETLQEAIVQKLRLNYGCTEKQATDGEIMKACALVLRDIMAERGVRTREEVDSQEKRKVHYMSMEFLMGRSLMKNAYNLELLEPLTGAVEALGFKAADIFDMEPDAGLGNGGLGRLAACYLDSMTTLEIPATGYSICYELGIFKQKIVDGQQVELPDDWKNLGDAWLMPKPQETEEVHFGGKVRTRWDNGHLMVVHEDYTRVLAVPCDMEIAGYDTQQVNTLRLWDAKSPKPIDMKLFSEGQYLRAGEERAMADVISKVLYPEDNHYEGKSLRLKQQYFFVSATMQSITRQHIQTYGTLKNFHEKNVIQINDTHPALVIPELMRILVDDAGLSWDEAWHITTCSVAYTNHTVLAEALALPLARIFVGYDAALLEMTRHGFMLYSLSFLFAGGGIFGSAFFTALNNGAVSALISFLRALVFQMAAVLLLPRLMGLDGVWLAVVAAETLAVAVAAACFAAKRKTYGY